MSDLLQGLTLMLVGMGTVFSFLTLLVLFVGLSSKVLNRFWPESIEQETYFEQIKSSDQSSSIVAAITAAIHQYRKNKNR